MPEHSPEAKIHAEHQGHELLGGRARRAVRALLPLRARRVLAATERLTELGDLEARLGRIERRQNSLARALIGEKFPDTAVVREWHAPANQFEFSAFSQNGEDGIVTWLFEQVGTSSKVFVEIGAGDASENSTMNLAVNHGWKGLMVEASSERTHRAKATLARLIGPHQRAVEVRASTATSENINALVASYRSDVDFLSIDIDGNDLWVWKELTVCSPRIVAIEYNASFGADRSVSVPNLVGVTPTARHPSGYCHGASVSALERIGREKGYQLVACDSAGVNAFFVRSDLLRAAVQPVAPQVAFYAHSARTAVLPPEQQWELLSRCELIEV